MNFTNRRFCSNSHQSDADLSQSYFSLEEWVNYFYQKIADLKNGLIDSAGFCTLIGTAKAVDIWSGRVAELEKLVRESGFSRGYYGEWC